MYRVVLVDDESVSLRFLRNYINSYFPNLEIMAEFETGIDALNFLRDNTVDLLITDVKMPIMNGVELAKCVRRMSKDVHIIIVSGYAEFDFAKGAMEADVDDYLLKPISLTNMQKTLSAIIRKLDDEYEDHQHRLIRALMNGQSVSNELILQYFDSKACCIAIVRIGNLSPRPYLNSVSNAFPTNYIKPQHTIIQNGRDKAEHLLISTQSLDIHTLHFDANLNQPITVILDSAMLSFSQLRNRVQNLFNLMDASVIIGKSQFLNKKDVVIHESARVPQNELRKIDYCLTSGNSELIRETFLTWGKSWDKACFPQRWIEKSIQQIVERFLTHVPALQPKYLQVSEDIDKLYPQAKSVSGLMEGIYEILYEILPEATDSRRSPEELYRQIQSYVEKNYGEPLTIQSVSTVVGISQAYLSKLFRKYSDKTFNEMLTHCRMENACRLLLEDSRLQLNDIASMVGYDSQSYFCKVFRQYTGMTPSQYAKKNREIHDSEGGN